MAEQQNKPLKQRMKEQAISGAKKGVGLVGILVLSAVGLAIGPVPMLTAATVSFCAGKLMTLPNNRNLNHVAPVLQSIGLVAGILACPFAIYYAGIGITAIAVGTAAGVTVASAIGKKFLPNHRASSPTPATKIETPLPQAALPEDSLVIGAKVKQVEDNIFKGMTEKKDGFRISDLVNGLENLNPRFIDGVTDPTLEDQQLAIRLTARRMIRPVKQFNILHPNDILVMSKQDLTRALMALDEHIKTVALARSLGLEPAEAASIGQQETLSASNDPNALTNAVAQGMRQYDTTQNPDAVSIKDVGNIWGAKILGEQLKDDDSPEVKKHKIQRTRNRLYAEAVAGWAFGGVSKGAIGAIKGLGKMIDHGGREA